MELVITTHSGKEYYITVEDYNYLEFTDKVNDNTKGDKIAIGGIVLSKIDIKGVVPKEMYFTE